jgi:hypothetical protein
MIALPRSNNCRLLGRSLSRQPYGQRKYTQLGDWVLHVEFSFGAKPILHGGLVRKTLDSSVVYVTHLSATHGACRMCERSIKVEVAGTAEHQGLARAEFFLHQELTCPR